MTTEKITKPIYRASYTKRYEDNKSWEEEFYYADNAADVYADFFEEYFDDNEDVELSEVIKYYQPEFDVVVREDEFFDGFCRGKAAEGLYYDLKIETVETTQYDGNITLSQDFLERSTDEEIGVYVRANLRFPGIGKAPSRFSKEDLIIAMEMVVKE